MEASRTNVSLAFDKFPSDFVVWWLERVAAGFENVSLLDVADDPGFRDNGYLDNAPSRQLSSGELRIFALANHLRVYFTPVIAALGILSSALYVPVLLRSGGATKSSHFHYLIALAAAGVLFLSGVMLIWLGTVGVNVYCVPGTCQFSSLINQAGHFIYNWCMVSLVVDRLDHQLMASRTPRTSRWAGHFAQTRAQVVVLGISAVALVVHVNLALMEGAVQIGDVRMCVVTLEFLKTSTLLNKIDIVVNFVLPFSLMIILDVLILSNHYKYSQPTPEPKTGRAPPGALTKPPAVSNRKSPKTRDDASTGLRTREDASTGPETRDDASTGPETRDDASTGLRTREDTSTGPETRDDASTGLRTREDASTGPETRDDTSTGPETRDDASTGPEKRDHPATGPQTRDEASTGPETGDDASTGPETRDDASTGPETRHDASTGPETRHDASTGPETRDDASTGPETQHDASKVEDRRCSSHVYRSFTAVAISLSYIVLTLPYHIQRSLSTFSDDDLLYSMSALGVLCQHVFSSLVYLVYPLNLIIITVADRDVRRALPATFRGCWARAFPGEGRSANRNALQHPGEFDMGLVERCRQTHASPV